MKIAVVGSRTFNNRELLFRTLDQFQSVSLLISGGAIGADKLAEEYGQAKGIPTKIFLPEYKKYGRSAPIKRNKLIIESADLVVAFWDGKSRGTKNSIEEAENLNKPVLKVAF